MDRDDDDEQLRPFKGEDYRGRPPKHSRFQKGKSGNPRGRPKKVRTPRDSALWALRYKIRVSENGVTRRISVQEAILRKCAKDPRKAALLFEFAFRHQSLWTSTPELNRLIRIKNRYLEASSAKATPMTDDEREQLFKGLKEGSQGIDDDE